MCQDPEQLDYTGAWTIATTDARWFDTILTLDIIRWGVTFTLTVPHCPIYIE